jgi:hypothetical protein
MIHEFVTINETSFSPETFHSMRLERRPLRTWHVDTMAPAGSSSIRISPAGGGSNGRSYARQDGRGTDETEVSGRTTFIAEIGFIKIVYADGTTQTT